MEETWSDVYCAQVTCRPTASHKLESFDQFTEKYLKNTYSSIETLVEVICDPVTQDRRPWIDSLLNEFLEDVGDKGFRIKDLPAVTRVLEFLGWRAREIPEYQRHLDRMLDICALPPLLGKPSYVLTCSEPLEQYFTHLGYLLTLLPTCRKILQLLESLHQLLNQPKSTEDAIKLEYLQRAAEKSVLPITVVKIVELYSTEIPRSLWEVAYDLVKISNICCCRMLQEGFLDTLLLELRHLYDKLREENRKDEIILLINIIWVLVHSTSSAKLATRDKLNLSAPTCEAMKYEVPKILRARTQQTEIIFSTLRNVFMDTVHGSCCNKTVTKIRNDLAMIILVGLMATPCWNIIRCGLAEDIVVMLKTLEIPVNQDDLFLRKILLAMLCHLAETSITISMMKEHEVMTAILNSLCIDNRSNIPKSFPQDSQLASCILRTLAVIAGKTSDEFIKGQGPAKLLTMLEWSMTMSLNLPVVKEIARTIFLLIANGNAAIVPHFKTAGIFNLIFKLINRILVLNELTLDVQRILAIFLLTLELVMRKDKSSIENYGDYSTKIIMKLLERYLHKNQGDFIIDERLMIAVYSYLWKCIITCTVTLRKFIELGGTYLVLDNLENATLVTRNILLGILSDMCTDVHCIPHLCTWRGTDKSRGLLSLLARLWREEEDAMGVQRTEERYIEDIELPLMGREQWEIFFDTKCIENFSPTLSAMLGSIRPKIYGIRKQLLTKSELYDKAKDHYRILIDNLPVEDSITFCIIDQLFRFLQGQVWNETQRYLKQFDVSILGVDAEILAEMRQKYRECGVYVRQSQEKILREIQRKAVEEELEAIAKIRDARLASALEAARTIDLVRCTADKNYRIQKKNEQKAQVDKYLNFPKDADPAHCYRSYPENWDVTTILHQIKKVQYCAPSFKKQENTSPSPSNSGTTVSYDFFQDIEY